MEDEKHYFKKIQSDYLLSYIITFFNLSDIRTLFLLSKKFLNILNKDNKKIVREIQDKIFGSESKNELILKELKSIKYNITDYSVNKSPIINSILADHYLISSSLKFDNGFTIYDLNTNKISQKISFNNKENYSYVSSLLYIKEKKLLLLGTENGYIVGYYFNKNSKMFVNICEYRLGANPIKNMIYYRYENKIIVISIDSDYLININFIRVFLIENSHNTRYNINYIKSFVIANYLVYNIKYFEKDNNNKFFALSLNKGNSFDDINNNLSNNFRFDKVFDNQISTFSENKINLNLDDIEKNKNYILNNNTYEELLFDYSLIGHKSYICDYLFLKNENLLISIDYLTPYLFIWDLNLKTKRNLIFLPHTDSILCLLNISDKFICSSGRDRKIFIYNIKDILSNRDASKIIDNFEVKCNHSSDVYKLNYFKDKFGNDKLISSSFDKSIKVFKMNRNFDKILSKIILTGHSSSICCIKNDLLRKEIITIDIDGVINRWEYNKNEKFFTIKKSIELNKINKKKEYIDDIILLYDNLNCIIKIDKTENIKVYSLSKEEFLYQYSEPKEKILKFFDCCNFNNFIGYSSNNLIKIYICKIQNRDNINYDYKIKNIKDINIDNINFKEGKMTCFKLLTWKYKLLGIGYNNGKIVIMKINNSLINNNMNITNNQFLIDVNSEINNSKKNIINQIRCIEFKNNKMNNNKEKENCILYLIISVNNFFIIYSFSPYFTQDLKINLINKIEYKTNIIFFEILNRNIIITSFANNNNIELIYLPKYFKNENNFLEIDEEPLIDSIYLSDEYINKILYTKNKKGIIFILNNSIKYLEFNKN